MESKKLLKEKKKELERQVRKKKDDLRKYVLQEREHLDKYQRAYRELINIGVQKPNKKQVEAYIEYNDQRDQAKSKFDWQRIVRWKSKIYRENGLHQKASNLENYLQQNIPDQRILPDLRNRNTRSLVRYLANREEETATTDIKTRCYLQTLLIESDNEKITEEIERNKPYWNWSPSNAKLILNTAKHLRVYRSTLKCLETTTKEKYYQSSSFSRLLQRYKEIVRENNFNYRFDKEKYQELEKIQEKITERIKKKVQSPDQFIRSLEEVKL